LGTFCETCGRKAELRAWKRIVPEYATLTLCANCALAARKGAADRGGDDDRARLIGLAFALAGEVWTEGDMGYWFREPLSIKKQPAAVPTWIPGVSLPEPSRSSRAEIEQAKAR
jgi:hypothetical protein